jgi:hypothetical protein
MGKFWDNDNRWKSIIWDIRGIFLHMGCSTVGYRYSVMDMNGIIWENRAIPMDHDSINIF